MRPAGYELGAGGERIEETGAGGRDVEAPGGAEPELVLNEAGRGGKEHVRCDSRDQDCVDVIRAQTPLFHEPPYRSSTHLRRGLARCTHPALPDAGSGDDPVVRGVEAGSKLGVGDNAVRKVRGDRGNGGAHRC